MSRTMVLGPAEVRVLALQLAYEGGVGLHGTPEGALYAVLGESLREDTDAEVTAELAAYFLGVLAASGAPKSAESAVAVGPDGLTLSGAAVAEAEAVLARVPPPPGQDGYPELDVPAYELERPPYTELALGTLRAVVDDLESGDPARRRRSEDFLRAVVVSGEAAVAAHRVRDPGVADA